MKKFLVPRGAKVLLWVSAAALLCAIGVESAVKCGVYLCLFGAAPRVITPVLLALLLCALVAAVAVILFANARKKWMAIMASGLVIAVAVLFCAILLPGNFEGRYFTYSSEDGARTIVVDEQTDLLSGYGEIYQRTSAVTMERIGEFHTDHMLRPFSEGVFRLEWGAESVTLEYALGANDEWCREEMQYVK